MEPVKGFDINNLNIDGPMGPMATFKYNGNYYGNTGNSHVVGINF